MIKKEKSLKKVKYTRVLKEITGEPELTALKACNNKNNNKTIMFHNKAIIFHN